MSRDPEITLSIFVYKDYFKGSVDNYSIYVFLCDIYHINNIKKIKYHNSYSFYKVLDSGTVRNI